MFATLRIQFALALTTVLALFFAVPTVHAVDAAGLGVKTQSASDSDVSSQPERNQSTARNAVYGFLMLARDGAWDEAAGYLAEPTGGWPEGTDPVLLARALKLILDERLWIQVNEVPDLAEAVDGDDEDAYPDPVVVGEIQIGEDVMPVEVRETQGRWSFAPETVAKIPQFSRALGSWWVAKLPAFFVDFRFAEIALWQWIGLAAIALIGALVGWLGSRVLGRVAQVGANRGLGPVAHSLAAVSAPVGVLLSLVAMQFADRFLGLSAPARANLSLGARAATALIVAWAVARWIRAMSDALEEKLVARGVTEGIGIVKIARMVAAVLVWLLGVSAALQIFGLDLSAVIAGLGIGTAALALASQQTLANLFGGASVLADRVLRPGDTVSIGGAVATVEKIGIRSTQLRTPDRTLLVVANSDLAQSRVEKMSARDGFRLSAVLGLRYETTPMQMRAIVAGLRDVLAKDAVVDPASVRVHFLAFGASSLDIDIKATIRTSDAAVYREAVERLNLAFMDVVAAHGSGFAFPSQTVYLARDAAPRG
jgi:MscS family membrane protein